ncbi:MAG: membrane associated rhomboid family serine protease [Patiriisocius sp.]|jgi:membrane associated rhomboid family serine protease
MSYNNLQYKFKALGVVMQIIAINTVIFLFFYLGSFFFQIPQESLASWFVLPDDFSEVIIQPWSIFTYAFLHFGFFHILFNMLWLFWFGPFVLNLFSTKRFLTIYLLGGMFGGLLYLISYNLFPVFAGSRGYLLGASAAVQAIIVFIATYSPNTTVRIFMFNIKLWHIAAVLVAKDVLQLPISPNAGGLLSHLGGAAFGYLYAKQLMKGNDIGKWFENMISYCQNIFKPRKEKPFTRVHRTQKTKAKAAKVSKEDKTDHQKKIDTILDKIGKSGYESLTKVEKDFLFKAGNQ